MGFIRRRAFDAVLLGLRFKDHFARRTNNRLLAAIGRRIVDPADVTLTYVPVNADIELPPGTVAPIRVVEHFLENASYHVSLDFCPCRRELKCEKYPREFGCTFIGEGARQIDPKLGRHIGRQEALDKLREANEMGLVSVLGRFKGDALALGVKDDARLMTICHCCPCCCVTTSIHLASPEMRDVLVRLEGVSVSVSDGCTGCGACVKACIFHQVELVDGIAVIGQECKGCGRCELSCKAGAIKIAVDNPSYVEESIARISSFVDVTGA
ncbi:MAG: 4Fe-4S ferredoxin [Actinomycetota bacterium]